LKYWEFLQHLQVFRNSGETGKEAAKNSSGCCYRGCFSWQGSGVVWRCWVGGSAGSVLLHEAWRFGFCGFGVKFIHFFHSTWMTSEARDIALPFPLMIFVLCSVTPSEADWDYRSSLWCFLYDFRDAAAL